MTYILDGVKVDVHVSGTIKLDIIIDQRTWDALSISQRKNIINMMASV